jgi:Tfp pilus assembly protein PilX
VSEQANQTERLAAMAQARHRDAGATFVEILVSIVLLGTVVVAVLAAVRTTVVATTTEREHSRALQWLESGAKAIDLAPFGNCNIDDGVAASAALAHQTYRDAVRHPDLVPSGWDPDQINVDADIDVWNGVEWVDYDEAASCLDDLGLTLQRVRLHVTNPDGRIIEDREVVKRG